MVADGARDSHSWARVVLRISCYFGKCFFEGGIDFVVVEPCVSPSANVQACARRGVLPEP